MVIEENDSEGFMKGIVFDFNGTLYWDSHLHYDAWRNFSAKLRGYPFSDDEMKKKMFGHTNEDIIAYAIGKKPSKELVEKCHRRGIKVNIWTLNDKALLQEYLDMGVDYITSDFLSPETIK